jgi:murein DD-endopeptidase MepM/ murein hydrolase activator NlpD
MGKVYLYLISFVFTLLLVACQSEPKQRVQTKQDVPQKDTAIHGAKTIVEKPQAFLFDSMLADGFDFPVGNKNGKGAYTSFENGKIYNGWYIAVKTGEDYSHGIHTGEDWNGIGGNNTDIKQPVHSIGKGKVVAAAHYGTNWGNIVVTEHHFVENGKLKTIQAVYAHLDTILVKNGTVVNRRQQIGTIGTADNAFPAHLHFEIRKNTLKDVAVNYWPSSNGKDSKWILEHYEKPSAFLKAHRKIDLAKNEEQIIVVIKHSYQMLYYKKGKLDHQYTIALSQDPIGHKQRQGDNRLPEGEYKIVEKKTGPFGGDVGPWLGVAWMRLNYPNAFDAHAAYAKNKISKSERDRIVYTCNKGLDTPNNTVLGGDIGIHGWNGDWVADGAQNLTWGCISMLNNDVKALYDRIPLKTKIIILP